MHLKRITLRNFRCFDEITLDLHPRLTVLVAENGGGKTALLDGIAIGLAPILKHLSTANQRLSAPGFRDTDFKIIPRRGGADLKSPYAQVIIEDCAGRRWDNWKPSYSKAQPEEKIGQADLAFLFEILDSYQSYHFKELPLFTYYGTQRGLLAIPQRLRGISQAKINYEYPTSALSSALDAQSDFKELMRWFDAEEAAELRRNRETNDHQDSPRLEAVRQAILAVLPEQRYTNPHFDSKHKFCVSSADGTILQVSQLSQGYQSMLALVMDFARRLALANPQFGKGATGVVAEQAQVYFTKWHPPVLSTTAELDWMLKGPLLAPAIMLIDEVDLHLHPAWQQRVLEDLMQAFPHTQFIVTTHSPQVLTTVGRENIRVLYRDDDSNWQAIPPQHSPFARESKDALAEVMLVDPLPLRTDQQIQFQSLLSEYQELVKAGKESSARAIEIAALLAEAGYEFAEADLALWRFLAERKKA